MNKAIITLVVVVFIHMGYNFIYKDLGDKFFEELEDKADVYLIKDIWKGFGINICMRVSTPVK